MAPESAHAPSPSRAARIGRHGLRLLAVFVAGGLLFQAGWYSVYIVREFARQRENTLAESSRVDRTLAVAHGEPLFNDLGVWPHRGLGAGFMLYLPTGYALRLVDLPDDRAAQARIARLSGRAVSLAGFLAILAALWRLGCLAALPLGWSFLPPLLFFSGHLIWKFATAFRPDLTMVALVLWAWAIALGGKRAWRAPVAALLMLLAIGYKPTALAAAGTLGLWLVLSRDFLRGALYTASGVLGFGAMMLTIRLATRNVGHTLDPRVFQTDVYWPAAWELVARLASKPIAILPLAGGLLAQFYFLFRRTERGSKDIEGIQPMLLAFAFSLLTTELIVLRPGSNTYYYLEPYCWGCVLFALMLRAAWQRLEAIASANRLTLAGAARAAAWAVLPAVLALATAKQARNLWADRAELAPRPAWTAQHPELTTILRRTRGEILLDEAYPYWLTQSPPTLFVAQGYSTLVDSGALSPAPLIRKIRHCDFELILLNYDARHVGIEYQNVEVFPPQINAAIMRHYALDRYLAPYYLYRPRKPKDSFKKGAGTAE